MANVAEDGAGAPSSSEGLSQSNMVAEQVPLRDRIAAIDGPEWLQASKSEVAEAGARMQRLEQNVVGGVGGKEQLIYQLVKTVRVLTDDLQESHLAITMMEHEVAFQSLHDQLQEVKH